VIISIQGIPNKQRDALPVTISLKARGLAYRVGLTKPIEFFPRANRASLMSVKMDPTTGADALVP